MADTRAKGSVRTGVIMLYLAAIAAAAGSAVAYMLGNENWGFAVVGFVQLGIFGLPFLLRRQRLLSLWGLVFVAVGLGMGLRGFLLAVNYPSPQIVHKLFLGGSSFNDLFGAAVVTTLVLTASVAGYMIVMVRAEPTRETRGRGLTADQVSGAGALVIASVYVAVSLYATGKYSTSVGGLGAEISARRTTITGTGAAFESYGVWQYLASAGPAGALFLLAAWMTRYKKLGLVRVVVIAGAFLAGFAINVVTTTRADVVYVSIAALTVIAITRGRVRTPLIAVAVLGMVISVGALTAERRGETAEGVGVMYGVESVVLSRNAADLSKTLRITDAVPEQLPYQYGRTITNYVLAPIPRSVWPDKPVISPGPVIGRAIYGLDRTGIPPGMSAELVWNFGRYLAVPFGFLIGLFLGWVERRFRPHDPRDLASVLMYALVVLTFGKAIYGVAIGQAFAAAFQAWLWVVPLWILGWGLRGAARKRSTRRRVPAANGGRWAVTVD